MSTPTKTPPANEKTPQTPPSAPQTPASATTGTIPPPTPPLDPAGAIGDKSANKPGRKPGQPAREWDYTGLDADFLAAPQGVTAELASLAAPMSARDPRQVAMDQVIVGLHREWTDAGKPDRWAAMPKRSYHVSPAAADTVRMLARRAAVFYGFSAKFGKPVRDKEGREIVVFAVRDMRVKKSKGANTWTLADLREFVTEFFGDDTEGADEFLAQLTGEDAEDSEPDSDMSGSGSPDPALRAAEWLRGIKPRSGWVLLS